MTSSGEDDCVELASSSPYVEPLEIDPVVAALFADTTSAPSTPGGDQLSPASTSPASETSSPDLAAHGNVRPSQDESSDSIGSMGVLTQVDQVAGAPNTIVFTQPRTPPSPDASPGSKQPRITDLWGSTNMADEVFASFSDFNSSSSSSSSSSSIDSKDTNSSSGRGGKGSRGLGGRGRGKFVRKSAKPAGKSAQRKLYQASTARADKKSGARSNHSTTTRNLDSLARQLAASPEPSPNFVTGSSARKSPPVSFETVLGGATDQHDTPQPRRTRSSSRTHGVAPPPPPSF